MPTYEFRCPKGHDFEKFYRSISAAPLEVTCPVCGKVAERQLSAGGGLVFKGSGFYITDYGKDGKKPQTPAVTAGEGATTASGADSTSKGESAGKAEPKAGDDSKPGVDKKSGQDAKPAPTAKPAGKTGPSKRAKGGE